jgi:hypothetical protein
MMPQTAGSDQMNFESVPQEDVLASRDREGPETRLCLATVAAHRENRLPKGTVTQYGKGYHQRDS